MINEVAELAADLFASEDPLAGSFATIALMSQVDRLVLRWRDATGAAVS